MSVEMHLEQYEFRCEPCSYVWQKTYEVRDADAGEHAAQYFYLSGLPASCATSGRRCPNCWEPTYDARLIDAHPARHHRLEAHQQFV